jgi:hypothetical protein
MKNNLTADNWREELRQITYKQDNKPVYRSIFKNKLESFIQQLLDRMAREMIGEEKEIIRDGSWGHTYNQGKKDGEEFKHQELIDIAKKYGVEIDN